MSDPPPLVLTPRRPTKRMNNQQYRPGEPLEAWVHPDDADRAGLADGQVVEVISGTGSIRLPARVTTAIAPGAVSLQHGWDGCNVNALIDAHALDGLTGMAHLSGTPVELRPVAN